VRDQHLETPLILAKTFPEKMISEKLVAILKKWKIPFVHTGSNSGRHRIVSVFFLTVMSLLIAIYLALMFIIDTF